MKKKMVNRKQCSDCGLYLVDGRHDLSGRGVNKENLMSVEEFERNLSALLKVPPLRKEKAKKEKIIVAQTGKETEIKPLLGKLKIKEIEKWVKETIVAIDSLIFELFPNSLRKIPHLNTYIRYELDKVHLLCLGVRQSKLWIYSPENEVTKNWLESQYINLINEKFTRRLEIFEEQNYREKLLVIEECLKLNQRKS